LSHFYAFLCQPFSKLDKEHKQEVFSHIQAVAPSRILHQEVPLLVRVSLSLLSSFFANLSKLAEFSVLHIGQSTLSLIVAAGAVVKFLRLGVKMQPQRTHSIGNILGL
jgi:hypothetical protein